LPGKGRVAKPVADAHAKGQYDTYAAHRREIKEQLGEADTIKALEELSKKKRS